MEKTNFKMKKPVTMEEHPYSRLLEQKVTSLEKEINGIKEMLQQSLSSFIDEFSNEIVELKDISYDREKEEIAEYFHINDGNEIGAINSGIKSVTREVLEGQDPESLVLFLQEGE